MAETTTPPTVSANGTESPQSRARGETKKYAQEKHARIEARLAQLLASHERQKEILSLPDASLVAGIERWYSVIEAARFFSRSNQWMYDRLRKEKFTYRDGTSILPIMVGDGPRPRRRFTLDLIREIAYSCYRSGPVKWEELKVILRRIAEAEFEEVLSDYEEE